MSLKITLSRDQMQQGKLIPNGYYSAVVDSITEDTTKKGDDMIVIDFKITGHPEHAGVPVRHWFGQWFGGGAMIAQFAEACTGKPLQADQTFDFGATKGVTLKIYNKQGQDQNGKPCNSIQSFVHKDAKIAS